VEWESEIPPLAVVRFSDKQGWFENSPNCEQNCSKKNLDSGPVLITYLRPVNSQGQQPGSTVKLPETHKMSMLNCTMQ
jgi:hypothetical protein